MLRVNRTAAWLALSALFVIQLQPLREAHAARKSRPAVQSHAERLASSGNDPNALDQEPGDSAPSTELAPGFLIQLSSGQDAKLSGAFRIQPSGRINLPYSVTINTRGMTLGRLRTELAKAYSGYFKGVPNLQTTIKQKRYWAEVLGLVNQPGEYLLRQNSPLDEIISLAGGVSEDLDNGYVRIVQGDQTRWVDLSEYYKGHSTEVPQWHGADRIFFQKERPEYGVDPLDAEASRKVQIIGEVRNPGEQTFRKEADAYYYLVNSGGPTSNSDLDRVEVVRPDKATGERKSVALGPVGDVGKVQGGDIMIFHPQKTSTFEKTLATTSIITSIVTTVLLTVIAVRQTK